MDFNKFDLSHVVSREFDLNMYKTVSHWPISYAIRELIANAIDEKLIAGFEEEIGINLLGDGNWTIKDYGRGLAKEHLVINENKEKNDNGRCIGKFGYGLKDALTSLFNAKREPMIISSNFSAYFAKHVKPDTDIPVIVAMTSGPQIRVGTVFRFKASKEEIEEAKSNFIQFAKPRIIDTCDFGQVVEKLPGQLSQIYANGMRIAEDSDYLYSFNITNLTMEIRSKLNRERNNLGKSSYSKRTQDILAKCFLNKEIRETLIRASEEGRSKTEAGIGKIKKLIVELKSKSGDAVYVSVKEAKDSNFMREINRQDKKIQLVTVEEKEDLDKLKEEGVQVLDGEFIKNQISAKQMDNLIDESVLTQTERDTISSLESLWSKLGRIFVRPSIVAKNSEWESMTDGNTIYISRSVLTRESETFGLYSREYIRHMTLVDNSLMDAKGRELSESRSRDFESSLTKEIGVLLKTILWDNT